jgi:hypothetical protein
MLEKIMRAMRSSRVSTRLLNMVHAKEDIPSTGRQLQTGSISVMSCGMGGCSTWMCVADRQTVLLNPHAHIPRFVP